MKKTTMKPIKFTFILALLASFTFISCDNEPLTGTFTDESGVPADGTGTNGETTVALKPFFAKVEGNEFSEELLEAFILNDKLWVRGTDAQTNKVTIGFPVDIAEGTFEIDAATYTGVFADNVTPIFLARADSGLITIAAHDTTAKTISGSFSFIATPSGSTTPQYDITEGEFNVSY